MEHQQHHNCPYCGQGLTYELAIDKGTTVILKRIAGFIRQKGINYVHLTKELESVGLLTSHQVGNISRPRFHGLVAKIKDHPGNYSLTEKGLKFLAGEKISKTAIIKKATKDSPAHTIGYDDELVGISDFDKGWGDYWQANGYEIKEGRVITRPVARQKEQPQASRLL